MDFFSPVTRLIETYKFHLLIFFLAVSLAVTFAHPQLFLTDEWVTVNQLSQLHEGHQVITNEGKYGFYKNGTPQPYFIAKHNFLGYSLFLPVISLPAYWLFDIFTNNFLVFIIYFWAFVLIAIALIMNTLFPEYSTLGQWRWTHGFIALVFLLFFLNLYLFPPFIFTGKDAYPELIAIVLTYCVLFAFLAVMIFEICRTIFENPEYALFGTFTCISCSSYLFWTSFCKDHLLVAFLVTALVLSLAKLWYSENPLFLAIAFGITGLLAWARPEIALGIAVALFVLSLYTWIFMKERLRGARSRYLVFLAPAFTFIGAIPFFINNYVITRNIFVPAYVLWANQTVSTVNSSKNFRNNRTDFQ